MAVAEKVLSPTDFVALAGTTVYTVPADTTAQIWNVVACNTGATEETIDIHFLPSGGAVATSNKVVSALPFNANISFIIEELHNHFLEEGMSVVVVASIDSQITFTMSGTERT